jgi:lipoate-protein ligase A
MRDDQTSVRQRGTVHINIDQDYERRDWAKRFGVTEDELKDAVKATGDSATKVRDYLNVQGFIKRLKDYVKEHRQSRPASEGGSRRRDEWAH